MSRAQPRTGPKAAKDRACERVRELTRQRFASPIPESVLTRLTVHEVNDLFTWLYHYTQARSPE